mmetsp:Transcript_54726/g.124638  ORF Transcript_54726/g.124638 Transcript_54726/m.124638 type:complete len:154 (+) Transcript_54726:1087-1548(+)
MSKHGLKHRPSNHRYRYERDLFRKFIEDNRDSTGRTKDHSGRFHGAEFYVDAKYTHLTEEKRAARYIPKDQIVECAFAFYLESHEQDLNVPVGKTVREWFGEDFGIGSELGHTVIHPRKTDVCAFCAKVDKRGEGQVHRHVRSGAPRQVRRPH